LLRSSKTLKVLRSSSNDYVQTKGKTR